MDLFRKEESEVAGGPASMSALASSTVGPGPLAATPIILKDHPHQQFVGHFLEQHRRVRPPKDRPPGVVVGLEDEAR